MKKFSKGFDIALQIGYLAGQALAKRPELQKEWDDVKVAIENAKHPDSHGGTRVTLTEIFTTIGKELLDVLRTLSPEIDALIELFDKDEDDEDG